MNYTSFQRGSLVKRATAKGYTWTLRYLKDGHYKALKLGDQDELPTEKDAERKAASMLAVINDDTPAKTFSQLVEKYKAEELPSRPQTASSYKTALKYLEAKFGDMPLQKVLKDLMAIQGWLAELRSARNPKQSLSMKTKQNIKAVLHVLINCAMKWGYLEVAGQSSRGGGFANPVGLVEVRKSKGVALPPKRLKVPIREKQLWALLNYEELPEHVRVMAKLCMFLGLRISEVLGFRWEDIDFERQVISIMRGSVGKHIDETKTATSQTSLPLHQFVIDTLLAWREYAEPVEGWLFGNIQTGRPFHRDSMQKDYLAPAGKALSIPNLGWHTFRHSHRAFLRALKVDPETQQLLLRHADLSTTMEYGIDDELIEVKRPANEALVEKLLASQDLIDPKYKELAKEIAAKLIELDKK